ncbi:Protein ROOT INITIATION DEFECTIVE 3 [Zea mays]|uniref:Protein ROOT INITIATION DEFECTIVE 3 n=1 Tax=Zea mays TaxID=4577 RepID=A0A1D6MD23_MAIZE|nr:Protein ROOT INITIATION DEFECTIVE 3 [Zea mays]
MGRLNGRQYFFIGLKMMSQFLEIRPSFLWSATWMSFRSMVVHPGYLILGRMLRMALQTNREQNGEIDTWSCRISLYMRSSIRCHPRGTHDAHALDIVGSFVVSKQ